MNSRPSDTKRHDGKGVLYIKDDARLGAVNALGGHERFDSLLPLYAVKLARKEKGKLVD